MEHCPSCGTPLAGTHRFCPTCGSPVETASVAGTAADPRSPSVSRKVGMIVIPLVVLGGLVAFYSYVNPSANPVISRQQVVSGAVSYGEDTVRMVDIPVRQEGTDLVFSLASVKQHRLVRFFYDGGKTERYVMAYIDPQGRLVTSMSISEHCGSTEFFLLNNQIYCAHCPSHWDMMTMEAYACCGRYYPDPIPSRVVGDDVHVAKRSVEEWAGRL